MVKVANTQSRSPESINSDLVAAVTAVNSTSTSSPISLAIKVAKVSSKPVYSPDKGSFTEKPTTSFLTRHVERLCPE